MLIASLGSNIGGKPIEFKMPDIPAISQAMIDKWN